jgi:hypothetical protein
LTSRAVTVSVYAAGPGLCTSNRKPATSSTPFWMNARLLTLLHFVQYVPVTTASRTVSM